MGRYGGVKIRIQGRRGQGDEAGRGGGVGGAVGEVWFGRFVRMLGVCARGAVRVNCEEFILREAGVM